MPKDVHRTLLQIFEVRPKNLFIFTTFSIALLWIRKCGPFLFNLNVHLTPQQQRTTVKPVCLHAQSGDHIVPAI